MGEQPEPQNASPVARTLGAKLSRISGELKLPTSELEEMLEGNSPDFSVPSTGLRQEGARPSKPPASPLRWLTRVLRR